MKIIERILLFTLVTMCGAGIVFGIHGLIKLEVF